MKKFIALVVLLLCCSVLTAVAYADNNYMGIDGKLEIIDDYTFSDGTGWYTYHFMVVKNISDETLTLNTSSIVYDADNQILGMDNSSFDALGAGCTSLIYDAFDIEGTADHFDTIFSAKSSSYYESVVQDISCEITEVKNGAVIFAKNDGEYAADFVEGYTLFLKDGEVVAHDSTYFTDGNSTLLPGKTIFKQVSCREEFDSIVVYFDGRRSSSDQPYTASEEESPIEILSDAIYSSDYGWYTYHFMVIKNNGSEDVEVHSSELVYDESGELLGADDTSFDVLGPGAVSVIYSAFDIDGTADHFDTYITANKETYYRSVVENISYTKSDIAKGAVVFATNNGDFAAQFVEGIALFYKDGKIVDYDTTYFTDDDNEIKPGETIFKQIDTYSDFDTIEVYFTGRAPRS